MREKIIKRRQNIIKLFNFKKRKIKTLLTSILLNNILVVTFASSNPVMAAEIPAITTNNTNPKTIFSSKLNNSYFQLANNTIMPRSTTYFIPDQQLSFTGIYVKNSFNVPTAYQSRLVIAAIGNEPLYVNVLNGKNISEHTITVTPNQAQIHVFNISSGEHKLKFSSITASQFTIRLHFQL